AVDTVFSHKGARVSVVSHKLDVITDAERGREALKSLPVRPITDHCQGVSVPSSGGRSQDLQQVPLVLAGLQSADRDQVALLSRVLVNVGQGHEVGDRRGRQPRERWE